MSSFSSLKKTINDLFSWSDSPEQPNKIQTKSQYPPPIIQTVQKFKSSKSQKQNSGIKNDINPQIPRQRKSQVQKTTVISYLKNILIDEQVQCLICLNKYRKPGVSKLCNCQHQYCKTCLKEYINSKLTSFVLPKCPQQQCDAKINKQTGFFRSLNPKTKQLFDKIEKFYFTSNDPFLKMCPSQNCQGIIPVIQDLPFQCVQCQNQFCKKCMYFKHNGKCAKNQAIVLNMKFNYRKCSKCGIIVQKSEACDHMTCKCGNEFCYRCGGKWTGLHHCQPIKITANTGQNSRNASQDCILIKIFKCFAKVVATFAIMLLITVYAVTSLIPMMLGTLIVGVLVGITFYTVLFIYNTFKNQSPFLGVVLIIFFPIAIFFGIHLGFKSFWGEAFLFWWEIFLLTMERPLSTIWN